MAISDSKLVDLHNRNNEHLFVFFYLSYITFLFVGFLLVFYVWIIIFWINGVEMDVDNQVRIIFEQYLKCTPEQKQILDEDIFQVYLDKTHFHEDYDQKY